MFSPINKYICIFYNPQDTHTWNLLRKLHQMFVVCTKRIEITSRWNVPTETTIQNCDAVDNIDTSLSYAQCGLSTISIFVGKRYSFISKRYWKIVTYLGNPIFIEITNNFTVGA